METALKRTPLYETHLRLGAKVVPFAGWELPLQYSGVIAEHRAVRERAGLFDVSHMGEIFVSGPEAEAALDFLTANDVKSLYDGKGQYSAILNEQGGVVDDIIVYRYSREQYLVCVNAANTEKDFAWFSSHNKFEARFENKSSAYGQIALQGPQAKIVLDKLFPGLPRELKYFHFKEQKWAGRPVIVARTGYTGEDGFEFFTPWAHTVRLWDHLLKVGEQVELIPAGLGARDSLRLEAAYPLYGNELAENISALDSGLSWIIKFAKGDFIGRGALLSRQKEGCLRALVGFFLAEPGIARHGDKVYSRDQREIGYVTSGTLTPTLNRALGLALIERDYAKLDTPLGIEVRGRKLLAHVVKRPFYKGTAGIEQGG